MRSSADFLVILGVVAFAACHEAEGPLPFGAPCGDSPECADGLVCAFERCRQPCDDARPCTGTCGGEPCTCFTAPENPRACELQGDVCGEGSPCPEPLLCRPEGRCTLRSFCGDGTVDDGLSEECDDGDFEGDDGCGLACEIEDGWECDTGIEPTPCQRICGNGVLNDTEECDDGDRQGADGCGEECEVETGWVCDVEAPSTCHEIHCGNGFVDPGEDCDDGDEDPDDGCDGSCHVEEGWSCDEEEPSNCEEIAACGNRAIDLDEQCDGGDGCDDSCRCSPRGRFGENCEACVRLVDPSNTDEGADGLTWATAFRTIQAAIDDAAHANVEVRQRDGTCDVWVREGLYQVVTSRPDEARGSFFIELPPGVRLIGGFERGATKVSDSAPRSNPTTLDGDGRVEHVVIVHQPLDRKTYLEATLEGFVITGGRNASPTTPIGVGAGVLVYQENSMALIRRCDFYDNHSDSIGGGLGVEGGASAIVENCIFRRNGATTGGGIGVASQSRLQVVSSTFYQNEASYSTFDHTGGAGVGIASIGSTQANPHVSSCIFADEVADTAWQEEVFLRDDSTTVVDVDHSYFAAGPRPLSGDNLTGARPFEDDEESPEFLHLLSGVAAIDSGAVCMAPPSDMANAARADVTGVDPDGFLPLPPPDIGAFEHPGEVGAGLTWLEACAPDTWQHDPSEYRYVPIPMPWPRAREYCVVNGGHLVAFGDSEELTAVLDALADLAPVWSEFWVGGVADESTGAFAWAWVPEADEGFPGDYSWGWEPGCDGAEDGGDACMRLSLPSSGTCDALCSEWRAFVCELDPA